jgi:hypothetical protein
MQQWTRAPSGAQLVLGNLIATCYDFPFECDANNEIVITGDYPHARYMSFTVSGASGSVISSVFDQEIEPDPGNQNPFVPDGDWDAAKRRYTLMIRFTSPPGPGRFSPGAGCNVLYADSCTCSEPVTGVITYCVYAPGIGYDAQGGAGLPDINCRIYSSIEEAELPAFGIKGAAEQLSDEICETSIPQERLRSRKSDIEWIRSGNLIPNTVDMKSSVLDRSPGKLLYLHWKAPRVPDTWHDVGLSGQEELRCWSMTFTAADSGSALKTISDFETIVDQFGYVSLVVGFGAKRPVFVTPQNGYTWVNLSGQPHVQVSIVYQNTLISPSFHFTAKDVPVECPVPPWIMGEYYPCGNYVNIGSD